MLSIQSIHVSSIDYIWIYGTTILYSCSWSTVVTQAAVYEKGSNFGLHFKLISICLIAMKSMVYTIKGLSLDTFHAYNSVKIRIYNYCNMYTICR